MKKTTISPLATPNTNAICCDHVLKIDAVTPYRLTYIFMFLFMLVSMGRIQSLVPFLSSVPLGAISTILTLLAFKAESRSRGGIGNITTTEERLVLGLFLVGVLSIPGSLWIKLSIETLIKTYFPAVVMFFIISLTVRRVEEILKIVWFYLFITVLILIISLKSGISHSGVGSDLYDPNDLALVLNCFLPFSVYFIKECSGFKKLLLISISVVIVATVVLTASRGGFLGLVIFGIYWIVTSRSKVFALTLACLALFLVPVFAPADTWDRISTLWNPQNDYDRTAGDRTYVWERGLKTFTEHPVLGVGIGCYAIGDGQSKEEGKWLTAHNSFIQLGVELGSVGLLLFISLIVSTILRIARLRAKLSAYDEDRHELLWLLKAVESSLIVYAIVGFFLSQAYLHQLYLVLALAVAVQKVVIAGSTDDKFNAVNNSGYEHFSGFNGKSL